MPKTPAKKTNAMRALDGAKISYDILTYACDDENFDGRFVAEQVGLPCEMVYKTLVVKGDRPGKNNIVVCCIPVDKKLDLKALSAAAGHKRLEMVHVSEILGLTGYIRGGCSPIGMKKKYDTYIDSAALHLEKIAVSAGIRGEQLVLCATDLISFTGATAGDFALEID